MICDDKLFVTIGRIAFVDNDMWSSSHSSLEIYLWANCPELLAL